MFEVSSAIVSYLSSGGQPSIIAISYTVWEAVSAPFSPVILRKASHTWGWEFSLSFWFLEGSLSPFTPHEIIPINLLLKCIFFQCSEINFSSCNIFWLWFSFPKLLWDPPHLCSYPTPHLFSLLKNKQTSIY